MTRQKIADSQRLPIKSVRFANETKIYLAFPVVSKTFQAVKELIGKNAINAMSKFLCSLNNRWLGSSFLTLLNPCRAYGVSSPRQL